MSAYLDVQNISKTYNGAEPVLAIGNVNLQVEQGQFVSILGPSGCGKTTLLRIIAGLERASSGQIELNGKRVTSPTPRLGVVFQEHRLFPWLTVRDNVEYGMKRQGVPRDKRRAASDHYLSLVGLDGFANQFPKALSIGMSQRVGIARALASDPDMLLMDEPFASVDAQTRRELQAELVDIWQHTGKTILFITHSVDEAILLSQRIVVLSKRPSTISRVFENDQTYPREELSEDILALKRDLLMELYD